MQRKHIAEFRLPFPKLTKLVAGGAIKVTKADVMNEANKAVDVVFDSPKHINRIQRAFDKGVGAVIKRSHFTDVLDKASGGSLLGTALKAARIVDAVRSSGDGVNLKSVNKVGKTIQNGLKQVDDVIAGDGISRKAENTIKKIGRTLAKPYEAIGVNPFTAGYDLGHDVIAPELMKAGIGPKYKGKGIKEDAVKVAKKVARKGKAAVKAVVDEGKAIYRRNKKQIDTIGRNMAVSAIETALEYQTTGDPHVMSDLVNNVKKNTSDLGTIALQDQLKKYKVDPTVINVPSRRRDSIYGAPGSIASQKARPVYTSEEEEAFRVGNGLGTLQHPLMFTQVGLGGSNLSQNPSIQGIRRVGRKINGGSFALPGERRGGSFALPRGGGFVKV